jgi:hypothetical protein
MTAMKPANKTLPIIISIILGSLTLVSTTYAITAGGTAASNIKRLEYLEKEVPRIDKEQAVNMSVVNEKLDQLQKMQVEFKELLLKHTDDERRNK